MLNGPMRRVDADHPGWTHNQAWDEYLRRCRMDKSIASTLPALPLAQSDVTLDELVAWHEAFDAKAGVKK